MANLITVPKTVWTDELFMMCPGASPAGLDQALLHTMRLFCKESAAWVVELWDNDSDNGNVPKPFNNGKDQSYYDFQSILEVQRSQVGPNYATGDGQVPLTQYYNIKDYWPWDILYIHRASYFTKFVWSGDTEDRTKTCDRFVYPTQTPFNRAPGHLVTTSDGWPSEFVSFNERPGAIDLNPSIGRFIDDNEGIVPWVALGFPVTYTADSVPVIFERYWYDHILDGAASRLMGQQDKPYTNPVLAQYHGRRFRAGIASARETARRQMSNSEFYWRFPAWA